jgi:hypothetical protein
MAYRCLTLLTSLILARLLSIDVTFAMLKTVSASIIASINENPIPSRTPTLICFWFDWVFMTDPYSSSRINSNELHFGKIT